MTDKERHGPLAVLGMDYLGGRRLAVGVVLVGLLHRISRRRMLIGQVKRESAFGSASFF